MKEKNAGKVYGIIVAGGKGARFGTERPKQLLAYGRSTVLETAVFAFASHKDRHECIGAGSLGVDTFRAIVSHPKLEGLPMILETPNELPGYAQEIALLRDL